ncbi:MAG: hypothetical protein ACP5KY_09285 [Thermoproteus sp.]
MLGLFAKDLEAQGYEELAHELRSFTADNRDVLITLEESYIESRYGESSYDAGDVSAASRVVKDLNKATRSLVSRVKLG